jgi:hypothetical protein
MFENRAIDARGAGSLSNEHRLHPSINRRITSTTSCGNRRQTPVGDKNEVQLLRLAGGAKGIPLRRESDERTVFPPFVT